MFEEYTYDKLLEEVLDKAPEDIDTRPGSIFYDAVSSILIKIARFYTDLDTVIVLTQLTTTGGEFLDKKASEYGITRLPATKAEYAFSYKGAEPTPGEKFYADSIYFTLCKADDGHLFLRANDAGTAANGIISGTAAIPVNNLPGLNSASFGAIESYGTDQEDDESLRARVQGKLSGSSQNGNKQHYKTWCESVAGVGKARIFPLWNGPNTVRAVLVTPLGTSPGSTVVQSVQDYIDPADKGYTTVVDGKTYVVGDGLGEGVANLGAHFTASAAEAVPISISVSAEIDSAVSLDSIKAGIEAALEQYFKQLALNSGEQSTVVRITSVGAIISDVDGVIDYSDLTLNEATENITIDEYSVPELGEVTVSALYQQVL